MVRGSGLSDEVKQVLISNGWKEDGIVSGMLDSWIHSLSDEFSVTPAARSALELFGGLRVEQSGPGEECARESFELDPSLALGEQDRFRQYANALGTDLYPLGEAGGGHVFLGITREGSVFALMDEIWFVGKTIDEAIETLVRGRQLAPVTGGHLWFS